MRPSAVLLVLLAVVTTILANGLPARSFYVGDPGVKLIAARNVIAHPGRPFEIDLPRIDNRPVPFVEPFFRVHGDHAHAATSELFPVLAAPWIWAFGLRGAYVMPALGFLLAVWATAWLGLTLDPRRSASLVIISAAFCSPVFFYGLEFWEHSLAVGAAALGSVLCVRRVSRLDPILAGVLFGVAMLLRPEGAIYCATFVTASHWLTRRPSLKAVALTVGGIAGVCLPFVLASWHHLGQPFGPHLASNQFGFSQHWLGLRAEIVRTWLGAGTIWWLCLLALAVILLLVRATSRRTTWAVSLLVGLLLAATLASARHGYPIASVWTAAPTAMVLLALLSQPGAFDGQGTLLGVTLVTTLLTVAMAPNDGGGQWGPRYLLFIWIPIPILIADVLIGTLRTRSIAGLAMVGAVIVASAYTQRTAYRELRSAKRTYEKLVDLVTTDVPPNSYIVTDVWWFDQVTAALYPTRTILFADTSRKTRDVFEALAHATPYVFLVSLPHEPSSSGLADRALAARVLSEHHVGLGDRDIALVELASRAEVAPDPLISRPPMQQAMSGPHRLRSKIRRGRG